MTKYSLLFNMLYKYLHPLWEYQMYKPLLPNFIYGHSRSLRGLNRVEFRIFNRGDRGLTLDMIGSESRNLCSISVRNPEIRGCGLQSNSYDRNQLGVEL